MLNKAWKMVRQYGVVIRDTGILPFSKSSLSNNGNFKLLTNKILRSISFSIVLCIITRIKINSMDIFIINSKCISIVNYVVKKVTCTYLILVKVVGKFSLTQVHFFSYVCLILEKPICVFSREPTYFHL